MPALALRLLANFGLRTIGAHLVVNHLNGAGLHTIQSLVEGLGWRFAAGMLFTLYLRHPAAVADCIAHLFRAAI